MENFIYESTIPHSVCEGLVDFFYNNESFKPHKGMATGVVDERVKVSEDISVPKNYQQFDDRIKTYLYHLDLCLKSYFKKYERSSMPCSVSDKFNIQHYNPGEGYKIWHHERSNNKHTIRRHLVWMTYLTDNPNGGTEFLYQKLQVPAEKGKTLIWPAEWMYTHRSQVDEELEKMIVTGWIEF